MSYNPSTKEMITIIAQALGELNDNAVFVGGATVPFYLPDPYLSAARPTEDVDVVLEIVSYIKNEEFERDQYSGNLLKSLRDEFKVLLNTSDFLDALPAGVLNRANVDAAVKAMKERMENF